jgi:hypothetical protein
MGDLADTELEDAARDRVLVYVLLAAMVAYVLYVCYTFAANGMSVRQARDHEPDELALETLLETHDD